MGLPGAGTPLDPRLALIKVTRGLANGDVQSPASPVLQGGLREAYDIGPHGGLAQPMRHKAPEHAALLGGPEIALLVPPAASLTRYDQHMAFTFGLAAREKTAECRIGVLLAKAMQVEPGIDLVPSARKPFGRAGIEGLRRWGTLLPRCKHGPCSPPAYDILPLCSFFL